MKWFRLTLFGVGLEAGQPNIRYIDGVETEPRPDPSVELNTIKRNSVRVLFRTWMLETVSFSESTLQGRK